MISQWYDCAGLLNFLRLVASRKSAIMEWSFAYGEITRDLLWPDLVWQSKSVWSDHLQLRFCFSVSANLLPHKQQNIHAAKPFVHAGRQKVGVVITCSFSDCPSAIMNAEAQKTYNANLWWPSLLTCMMAIVPGNSNFWSPIIPFKSLNP